MKKIIVVIFLVLVGCTHSKKPVSFVDPENTVIEDNANLLIEDSVNHLNYFDFLIFENNFYTQSPYSMNEEFEYKYEKYLRPDSIQIATLIPNFEYLDELKATGGPGVWLMTYKKNRNYMMIKYYLGGSCYEGYFLVVYDKKGNIMDYLTLDWPFQGDLLTDTDISYSLSKTFQMRKDTVFAIEKECQVNETTLDTIYKSFIQSSYTLNPKNGIFIKIAADTTEKGNKFRYAKTN